MVEIITAGFVLIGVPSPSLARSDSRLPDFFSRLHGHHSAGQCAHDFQGCAQRQDRRA